jgi:ABC-type multidrug transport system fused ATPase/permease subunit
LCVFECLFFFVSSALFCGQNREAALVTDSIPANIVWGRERDERVLRAVLRGTGLDADLGVMVEGENTVVGERGVTLRYSSVK